MSILAISAAGIVSLRMLALVVLAGLWSLWHPPRLSRRPGQVPEILNAPPPPKPKPADERRPVLLVCDGCGHLATAYRVHGWHIAGEGWWLPDAVRWELPAGWEQPFKATGEPLAYCPGCVEKAGKPGELVAVGLRVLLFFANTNTSDSVELVFELQKALRNAGQRGDLVETPPVVLLSGFASLLVATGEHPATGRSGE